MKTNSCLYITACRSKSDRLLGENPRGILTFRDELMGLLGHLDKEEFKEDRAFYLQGWNGTAALFTYDRIGRGTIDIENVCVSVFGGIQPSRLKEYLYYANRNVLNDGLIQRFQLAVYPDEPDWNLVDKWPDREARNRAYGVIAQLAEMDFKLKAGAHRDEGDRIPYLRFASNAQALFYAWLTDLQERVKTEEHPIIAEHLCKYPSLMPSLALIFHLIEVAAEQATGPVSLHPTEQAAAWCDYLETHARRIYGLSQDVTQHAAATLARKIQEGRFGDGFTARDVYRNLRGVLADRDVVQAALGELVEAGWLRRRRIEPTGGPNALSGRGKTEYVINPKVNPGQ